MTELFPLRLRRCYKQIATELISRPVRAALFITYQTSDNISSAGTTCITIVSRLRKRRHVDSQILYEVFRFLGTLDERSAYHGIVVDGTAYPYDRSARASVII